MSFDRPLSSLTSQELARIASFKRDTADNLDAALASSGAALVPTTRQLSTTTPLHIAGGASADLSVDRAFTIDTFSPSGPGVVPASPGGTAAFIRADGQWAVPPGATPVAYFINVKDYGALGNGSHDDTTAIQAALNAAATSGAALVFPSGNYLVTSQSGINTTGYCLRTTQPNIRMIGFNATITWNSSSPGGSISTHCIKFDTGCTNVVIDGLTFVGSGETHYTINTGGALYFIGTVQDSTVKNCTFSACGTSVIFASDGTVPGRFIFTGNRSMNLAGGMATPYRSIIENNIFDCDALTGNRSHMIYIYGAIDGCVINGNVFRRSDSNPGTYAVQIRAAAGRYDHKHSFVVTNNQFYECYEGIFCGSDEEMIIGEFVIEGNVFHNCKQCISAFGSQNTVIANNVIEATWEAGSNGGTAIYAAHGGIASAGHLSNCELIIKNNTIFNHHPFFGIIDIVNLPVAGDTITIGPTTYTWRAAAAVAGELTIGATTTDAATNLVNALRAMDPVTAPINTINKVLRNGQDAMHSQYTYDGSLTNRVIVASFATFTISNTGAAISLTQPQLGTSPNAPYACGIKAEFSFWPTIEGNMIKDLVPAISINNCIKPTVSRNTCIGGSITGLANVKSLYESNRFVLDEFRESRNPASNRWLGITDGFWIARNNGEGDSVAGQLQSITGNGYAGVVSVGDGRARCRLYYGGDTINASYPTCANTFPWRWADGDQVQLTGGVSGTVTYTFKRTTPGAGQFNTADSLIALINASTDYSAAYVDFTNTGGDTDPKLMIEITYKNIGVAGNSCVLNVLVAGVEGVDRRSTKMCGVILLDRNSGKTQSCNFLGGAATATKTVIWSPVLSNIHGVRVSGYDAASQALGPVVYGADIIPEVAAVITHSVAAGTEKFFYNVL